MSKNRVRSRIMLDADVQDAALLYREQCGAESFSKALCMLARVGAAELQRCGAMFFPSPDREVL